jgi:hypothetical protein
MPKEKRSRDWSKVKGYRKSGPYMPLFSIETNVVQVVHNKAKFEFWTEKPVEQPLAFKDVHGCRVDDRVHPPFPQGFDRMRPLRKPDRKTPIEAKQRAFAVLQRQRRSELVSREQPKLFPEHELPTQYKPSRK